MHAGLCNKQLQNAFHLNWESERPGKSQIDIRLHPNGENLSFERTGLTVDRTCEDQTLVEHLGLLLVVLNDRT